MAGKKKNMTFEEAMEKLKEIVSKMEDGQLSLEDSMNLFKEGMELSAFCNKKLDEAEKKVTMLTKDKDGFLEEEDFETKEDNDEL